MLEDLIENIIWQADYFLKESGEFYPFASVIHPSGEIKPLGVLLDKDKPSPEEVLQELEKVLKIGKNEGFYLAYAICINMSITEPLSPSHDALEIRVHLQKDGDGQIWRIPYIFQEDSREVEYGSFKKV